MGQEMYSLTPLERMRMKQTDPRGHISSLVPSVACVVEVERALEPTVEVEMEKIFFGGWGCM